MKQQGVVTGCVPGVTTGWARAPMGAPMIQAIVIADLMRELMGSSSRGSRDRHRYGSRSHVEATVVIVARWNDCQRVRAGRRPRQFHNQIPGGVTFARSTARLPVAQGIGCRRRIARPCHLISVFVGEEKPRRLFKAVRGWPRS